MGPFGAINPRIIWKIVILVMSLSAGGYLSVRLLGPRLGFRIHKSLRVTPAMQAGVTDHVWSLEELFAA